MKNSFSCMISFKDSVMLSQAESHIKHIKSTDVTETDSLSFIIVLRGLMMEMELVSDAAVSL